MTNPCADGCDENVCDDESQCITVELDDPRFFLRPASEIFVYNRRRLRAGEEPQSKGYDFIDGYLITLGDLASATEDLGEPEDGVPIAIQHLIAAELTKSYGYDDYVFDRPELIGKYFNVAYQASNNDIWTFGLHLDSNSWQKLNADVITTITQKN